MRAKAASQPCLHEVTVAAGWGETSEAEQRLARLALKLGYMPGQKRSKAQSRLATRLTDHAHVMAVLHSF